MSRRSSCHQLLVALSLGAGCVDAAGFMTASVFPANMTGNSVLLALALANVKVEGAWLAGLVLVCFCLGAAAGSWLLRRAVGEWSREVRLVLFGAGAILVLGTVVFLLGGKAVYAPLFTAAAMGMQAAAVQQVGVSGVSTIVVTSTLVTVIRRAVGAATAKAAPGSRWIPAWSWVAYFGGALLGGGLQRFAPPPCPMLFAAAVILTVAATSGLLARGDGRLA